MPSGGRRGTTNLDSVISATEYLNDVDLLTVAETALVRTICANVLQDPKSFLWHEANNAIILIQLVAQHST